MNPDAVWAVDWTWWTRVLGGGSRSRVGFNGGPRPPTKPFIFYFSLMTDAYDLVVVVAHCWSLF